MVCRMNSVMGQRLKNAFFCLFLIISLSSGTSLKAEAFKNDGQEILIEVLLLQFLIAYPTLQSALLNIHTLYFNPNTNPIQTNPIQNNFPEVEFGQGLVQAANQVILDNSLVYVIHRASSTYGGWRLDGDDWDMVYNGWCWELLGILLYESGYSTDTSVHNAYAHEIEHQWSDSDLYPELAPDTGAFSFQAGDLIFMNGSDHVVIATGNGDEVFSLWNRPDRFLLKISLSELIKIWPGNNTPRLHKVPVQDVFRFLEHAKSKSDSKHQD